ncbi:hypothetical protein EVAR_61677_1 [Eumeta japonica]|uniref:Uncharacterized protein n=1 Tax=Eumeta variegata TaxID=151549 RepID=A0A4C1YW24_EUMVA|nr:hypothetical protein EVAR_61677_1 [Eumeta japonica]
MTRSLRRIFCLFIRRQREAPAPSATSDGLVPVRSLAKKLCYATLYLTLCSSYLRMAVSIRWRHPILATAPFLLSAVTEAVLAVARC